VRVTAIAVQMTQSSAKDMLARRVVPSAVIALSQISWPSRLGAASRRALGRRGRVELFFAFDDPCSAIAVIDLAERVSGRDVLLLLKPVVKRGISDDPAAELKRRYAIADAQRLGRRRGLMLTRTEPLTAEGTRFLADWAASAPQGPSLERFCVNALRQLWLAGDGRVHSDDYAAPWREQFGGAPPAAGGDRAVRRNERLMKFRGPYDTPAAWVHGQWFFAHDRLAQIGERLDDLGWTVA
jgi:2-hydroxychromene-2-carboxylate isomerase